MKKIHEVLFWAGVLITVCSGCRWGGQDFNQEVRNQLIISPSHSISK